MLEYVRGRVVRLKDRSVVVDVNGIGVGIEMISAAHLKPSLGKRIAIPVCLDLSSGEPRLFGFKNAGERDLFKAVTGIPGIGPATAFKALEALVSARGSGSTALPHIEGIGPSKHARLQRWLKSGGRARHKAVSGEKARLLREALAALGMPRKEASSKAATALESEPGADIDELIRIASRK